MVDVKKNALRATVSALGMIVLLVLYSFTEYKLLHISYFIYLVLLIHYNNKHKKRAKVMSKKSHLKITIDELYNDERELDAIMVSNRFSLHVVFGILIILGIVAVSFHKSFGTTTLTLGQIGILLLIVAFIAQFAYILRLFYELRET
ncbi:hypothetical protein AB3K25_01710 [Leuconostoc sp. MS02]|uniref:Uncharacterized protein n=1 Tax=Leuconostoc aquikimchii TaxID=3236804 RepID=A0ABV3S4G6_9LACO